VSSGPDEERSPEGRARAEKALVTLVHRLDNDNIPLIVLGGLLPEILTEGRAMGPTHLGTTDVDMLVAAHLDSNVEMGELERALVDTGFEPAAGQRGWRWRGRVDGVVMKLEFLCDLETERSETLVALPGCGSLRAMNLRGTGYVTEDWRWRELTAELDGHGTVRARARFAGLEGYLLSKCVACRQRGADKDYYDLVFVLLYNRAGGPSGAAKQLRSGALAKDIEPLRSTLREVHARFYATTSQGPAGFALQSLIVDPTTREPELRARAVGAVDEFIKGLLP
jgi:hypothetical protein